MRVLGLLSGTSHDGIDAAVVEFSRDGGVLNGVLLHRSNTPYPGELRRRLAAALPPAPTTMADVCQLDTLIGQAFADAADSALADAGAVDLIVTHGQTVFHWVEDGYARGTLQIGQPAWLAERTGTPVVSDVHIRDITAGGQGAPLVSLLDALLLGNDAGTAAALNLGGIANVTVVRSRDDIDAYDLGPANALIDAVVAREGANARGFDEGGRIASAGVVNDALLAAFLDDPYYLAPPPKTTGKEHFHGRYIDETIARAGVAPSVPDLVATLTELTVQVVARELRAIRPDLVVASGGGCRNPVIMEGLRRELGPIRLVPSDEFGVPSDEKEAIAFAVIGWFTVHGIPGTVPSGTGATGSRILGSITPGAGPLVLPEPVTTPITSITMRVQQ